MGTIKLDIYYYYLSFLRLGILLLLNFLTGTTIDDKYI